MAKQPVESALATALAETAEPSWAIDLDKSMLIGANAAGSKLWGLSPIGPPSALVLDSAMPALRALRDRLNDAQSAEATSLPLTLWTLRGPLTRTFNARKLALADRSALALVSLAPDTPPTASSERQMAPERRYRLVVDTSEVPTHPGTAQHADREPQGDAATLQEIARRIRQGVVASVSTSPRNEQKATAPAVQSRAVDPTPPIKTDTAEPPAISSEALAKIAHELRTPLAAIISMSEVITQERFGPLPHERYRGYVRDILDSARHGLTVLDGMIGAEALATGTPELVFSDLDLNAEVEATLATMQPLADRSGARIDAALVSGLPRVIADRRSVRQMLINLVGNSLKHGGPNVRVKVTTGYELAGMVWIAVEDDGVGMPAASDAPGGLPPNSKRPSGSGLGLPLTRKLTQANGASFTIDSAPGKGTLVRIVFPKDRTVPV